MVDGSAPEISVTIAGHDLCLRQSPGLLTSSRSTGTTGAAVWRTTRLLAEWFASKHNPLFSSHMLHDQSVVLELGSGVGGLLGLVLGPRVALYCATDQPYATKLLKENIEANTASATKPKSKRKSLAAAENFLKSSNIRVAELDWETDEISYFLSSQGMQNGVDCLLASDCVYNYHLIEPFVQTCADICAAREGSSTPTICIVAQQLRQPDVFEEWLTAFSRRFAVWRLKDDVAGLSMAPQSGYVVHIGVLQSFAGA